MSDPSDEESHEGSFLSDDDKNLPGEKPNKIPKLKLLCNCAKCAKDGNKNLKSQRTVKRHIRDFGLAETIVEEQSALLEPMPRPMCEEDFRLEVETIVEDQIEDAAAGPSTSSTARVRHAAVPEPIPRPMCEEDLRLEVETIVGDQAEDATGLSTSTATVTHTGQPENSPTRHDDLGDRHQRDVPRLNPIHDNNDEGNIAPEYRHPEQNQPLYNGCRYSVYNSVLMLMAVKGFHPGVSLNFSINSLALHSKIT